MRYQWIRDRITRGYDTVTLGPGLLNLTNDHEGSSHTLLSGYALCSTIVTDTFILSPFPHNTLVVISSVRTHRGLLHFISTQQPLPFFPMNL